ncbi:hypothetical protein BOX15_Mlig018737g2, partial [Macrostomum lignano]
KLNRLHPPAFAVEQAMAPLILLLLTFLATTDARNDRAISVSPARLAELSEPLAVIRQVGTSGHRRVRNHLVEFLSRQPGWQVELDTFHAETPIGRQRFDNIIATLRLNDAQSGSSGQRRLVLAAHYDSKLLPGFVGATDSAVPCAVLLRAAETIGRAVARASRLSPPGPGVDILQLVFFDGEEAFKEWTRTDSLYGSRHLAQKWAQDGTAQQIEALVLLDLIGGRNPKFYYNPHPSSDERVIDTEMRMFIQLGATEAAIIPGSDEPDFDYFQLMKIGSGTVQDDQLPFQEIGVPTVHLIPQPFPAVWHTPADTLDAIEWDQAADVANIVLFWTAQTIGL